jgi:hypothetical protein
MALNNTGNWNTGNWNTGDLNTGNWNTGNWNTGDLNTGDLNTGNWNTGNWNTGNRNTGDLNTGNLNTGNWNTGNWNTGDLNTGNWNTGNWNTGDLNTGNWNTGNRNTGNWNTGNWNTGDLNTGNLNTTEAPLRIFNKETNVKREDVVFPDFFYFYIIEWVYESEMTDKEKTAYPSYVTTGGYLKAKNYKTAWRESWDKATLEDKKRVLALPNWNNELFLEISGIDVEKELNAPKKSVDDVLAKLSDEDKEIIKNALK